MRLWIAVFLFFLFATQALPVSALSKAYGKTELSVSDGTGDEDDNTPAPKGGKVKKQNSLSEEDYDHSQCPGSETCAVLVVRQENLHRHDCLYVPYSGEVTTPPPDYC